MDVLPCQYNFKMPFTRLVAAVNHDIFRLVALWEVDPELRSSTLTDVHQGIKNENILKEGAGRTGPADEN